MIIKHLSSSYRITVTRRSKDYKKQSHENGLFCVSAPFETDKSLILFEHTGNYTSMKGLPETNRDVPKSRNLVQPPGR